MKVLLVEDDPQVRLMACEALAEDGFDVIEAGTGEDALRCCAEGAADVLFTDIHLSGDITGWDVAEHCRERNPSMPVVYATGYNHVRARPVPGSVWFQKPYRPLEIVRTIRQLLERERH
jgi:CheY-like chemotaxis protein